MHKPGEVQERSFVRRQREDVLEDLGDVVAQTRLFVDCQNTFMEVMHSHMMVGES